MADIVEEVMGDYGLVSLSERVLQKVWLNQNFDTTALLSGDGRSLQVLDCGEWNRGKGPDFRNARFILGGKAICGDVEIHFKASDWVAHKHHNDPAYNNVCLHVVLYPHHKIENYYTLSDHLLPSLCLLPLLHEDLEQLAMHEALMDEPEIVEMQPFERFAKKSMEAKWRVCLLFSEKRWNQKVEFARQKILKYGWDEACHLAVMDALGYSKNRIAMLNLAINHPLDTWRRTNLDLLYLEQKSNWCLHGVRPSNHPRTRLRQYISLNSFDILYPQIWGDLDIPSPSRSAPTASIIGMRRSLGIKQLRELFEEDALCGVFSGNRLDSIIHNVLLPYLTSKTGINYYIYWFYWFTGDCPVKVKRILNRISPDGEKEITMCNGVVQSILQTLLEG